LPVWGSRRSIKELSTDLLWHAPAKYHGLNAPVRDHASPPAIAPLAQERNDVRADVIFAKDLKRLVGRRGPFMNEGIDALLPCCHRKIGRFE
jgi:hypothetical protein